MTSRPPRLIHRDLGLLDNWQAVDYLWWTFSERTHCTWQQLASVAALQPPVNAWHHALTTVLAALALAISTQPAARRGETSPGLGGGWIRRVR